MTCAGVARYKKYSCTYFCTHSQFLMPGLVNCHVHPAFYFDVGKQASSFLDFVRATFIPRDLAFRNTTVAREVSMALVVSGFIHSCNCLHYYA